jgi:hypothetical protein
MWEAEPLRMERTMKFSWSALNSLGVPSFWEAVRGIPANTMYAAGPNPRSLRRESRLPLQTRTALAFGSARGFDLTQVVLQETRFVVPPAPLIITP